MVISNLIGDTGKVQTVVANGNDVCETHMREASNPDDGDEHGKQTTHNPPKAKSEVVVYRVTSLPLDVYSQVAKNMMWAQDKEKDDSVIIPRNKGTFSISRWWGCCWIGWLGDV